MPSLQRQRPSPSRKEIARHPSAEYKVGLVLLFVSPKRHLKATLMALMLLLGGCTLSAPPAKVQVSTLTFPIEHTSFAGEGCSKSNFGNYGLSQSMSGAISSCLRISAVPSGSYSIALYQIPSPKGSASAAKGLKIPTGGATNPEVKLALSPSSGPPGTRVQVTGRLVSPPAQQVAHANLCWDSCAKGLQYSGVRIKWLNPTTFETSMVVPNAPWITVNPVKISPLISGNYAIGAQCLGVLSGCALGSSEGSATFHLSVPKGSTSWCKTTSNCAFLATSPKEAFPGDVIKITGFAPLLSVIGSDHPFVFQLQMNPGGPKGPEVSIRKTTKLNFSINNIYFGHAPLRVLAPPTFASLGNLTPTALVSAGLPPISTGPAGSGLIEWCGKGTVNLVGRNRTTTISTAPVAPLLKQLGFGSVGPPGSPPSCDAVASEGAGAVPKLVVAAFTVAPEKYAPPIAEVALMTKNGGATWGAVPVPKGASMDGFGGFRYQGTLLELLYQRDFSPNLPPSTIATPLVEGTNNGGGTWRAHNLSCPTAGPCVSFGPFTDGNCAGAIGSDQPLIYSPNHGKTWLQPSWPRNLRTCSATQLATISPGRDLLVESDSQYLLRVSSKGGRTWTDVSMPLPPGTNPGFPFGVGGPSLTLLPDGALLVTGQRSNTQSWELLKPRATKWCRVVGLAKGIQRSASFGPIGVIGNMLWWFPAINNPSSSVRQLKISDIHCQIK